MISPRLCRVCRQLKPISEFYRSRTHLDGYEYRCRSCKKAHKAQQKRRPKYPLRVEEMRLSVRKTGDEPLPWVVSDGHEIISAHVSQEQAEAVAKTSEEYLNGEIPDKPIKVVYKSPTETALARRRQRAAQAA